MDNNFHLLPRNTMDILYDDWQCDDKPGWRDMLSAAELEFVEYLDKLKTAYPRTAIK